jgi:hypothetical protein
MACNRTLLSWPTRSASPRKSRAETERLVSKVTLFLKRLRRTLAFQCVDLYLHCFCRQARHIELIFDTLTDKVKSIEAEMEKLARTNRKLRRQLRVCRRIERRTHLRRSLSKDKDRRLQNRTIKQDLTINALRQNITRNISNSNLGLALPLRPKELLQ